MKLFPTNAFRTMLAKYAGKYMGDSEKSDTKMQPAILVADSKETDKEKSEQSDDTKGNGHYQKYMKGPGW